MSKPTTPLRAVIYARVSTSNHGQNPEVQLVELRNFCSARGWPIVEEIVDHGYTGSSTARPGLKRLNELARTRKIDAIVIWKLDRLFRSLKNLVSSLEEYQALGITFAATRDNVDYSTPSGRLFAQLLGILAEFEKELLKERTIAGLEFAKAKGKKLGRPQKHDPEAIKALRAKGLSYREIQKSLKTPMSVIARALSTAPKTAFVTAP